MSQNEAILEGCSGNILNSLYYMDLGTDIPENATVVLSGFRNNPERFLRYDPNSLSLMVPLESRHGYPIYDKCHYSTYLLDFRRAIITPDKRIYISEDMFEPKLKPYLDSIPLILKQSRLIFSGEITDVELNDNPTRIF